MKAVRQDRLPLTPAAKTTLQETGKPMRRGRRIAPVEVLSALLEIEPPDPAAALLQALGVDRPTVRAHLAR